MIGFDVYGLKKASEWYGEANVLPRHTSVLLSNNQAQKAQLSSYLIGLLLFKLLEKQGYRFYA